MTMVEVTPSQLDKLSAYKVKRSKMSDRLKKSTREKQTAEIEKRINRLERTSDIVRDLGCSSGTVCKIKKRLAEEEDARGVE